MEPHGFISFSKPTHLKNSRGLFFRVSRFLEKINNKELHSCEAPTTNCATLAHCQKTMPALKNLLKVVHQQRSTVEIKNYIITLAKAQNHDCCSVSRSSNIGNLLEIFSSGVTLKMLFLFWIQCRETSNFTTTKKNMLKLDCTLLDVASICHYK